jgi:hypothetical protein
MMSDRFEDNQPGQNEGLVHGARQPGVSEMMKERETKEDGRYIIFYSFGGDEEAREDG